jgi:Peptidase family M28/PDZ domain/PA domain
MFRVGLIGTLVAVWMVSAAQGEEVVASAEARLKTAVDYLASDELEGRGVDTAGINKAADYLATEFKQLGLRTELFDGSPFQKFEITVKSELGAPEKNKLLLIGPPAKDAKEPTQISFELGKNFTPLAVGGSGAISAPLVFVGYGITDTANHYDDYAGVDVKNKVVVILRKEPQQGDEKSVFNGKHPSQHATFMRKLANAFEHGAQGVILVNDDYEGLQKFTEDKQAWRTELEKFAVIREKLATAASPVEEENIAAEINRLAESIATRGRRMKEGYDELLAFAGAGEESGHKKMPVWFALRASLDPVIQQACGRSLAMLEREIDEKLQPVSQELAGWKIEAEAAIEQVKAEVKNVIAILDGEGPLAEETIVIGAHYDHVGWGGPASLAPWTHAIHNGADDNASGTAALLETARRIVATGKKPMRRIAFMAFTGEERGLLGSAYYCRHPRFALEKTIAMFNMDMVGRLREDKLIVYGTGTATEFDGYLNALSEKHKFQLTKHEGGFGPSDQASFYAQKIPVLHLFTGNHDDYHRPSDDAEKINAAGMNRIVAFLVDIVQQVDTTAARPSYVEIKKVEHIGEAGDRPYFGSIPDYSQASGEGLAIMGAVKDGPADKAGLKGGDLIVQFGESKIGGIEDFDSALRKFKPGDRVKIKVVRAGQPVELEVVLGKRK